MKICHIITRLIVGGAQENTLLTCEGLSERGHDVTLITGPAMGPEGELMTRALAGEYRVIVVDEMRREINALRDLLTYRRLKGLLRELGPDVVHTHSSKAGILGRQAAGRLGGMKIVHTVHGLPYHRHQSGLVNRFYIGLERRAAARSDAIISVADAMTVQALAAGVGLAQQYTTIYSGMEVEPFINRPGEADEFRRSLKLPAEAVLITQVSRLAELKGHEYLLAAAAEVADLPVWFCLVGDGELRGQIEAEIERRELAGRFHLTGLVPPARIPAIMHASDIVIHCSLREGLARALPQAMLAGKSVISFDTDGAGEVVNDRTGILVAPKDTAGLVRAIRKLAGDAALRSRMGQEGRNACRERFDHNHMVDQIEAVYRRVGIGE